MKQAEKIIQGIERLDKILDEWQNNTDTEKSNDLKVAYIDGKTEFCQMVVATYKTAKAMGYELCYLTDEEIKKLGG